MCKFVAVVLALACLMWAGHAYRMQARSEYRSDASDAEHEVSERADGIASKSLPALKQLHMDGRIGAPRTSGALVAFLAALADPAGGWHGCSLSFKYPTGKQSGWQGVRIARSAPVMRQADAVSRRAAAQTLLFPLLVAGGIASRPAQAEYEGPAMDVCSGETPNCFSSIPPEEMSKPPWWLVEPFRYTKSTGEALAELKAAVNAYPPGQRGVDRQGCEIKEESADGDATYLHVVFVAKAGYKDDVVFRLSKGVCDVRTSSRDGSLDFGVNAKRYNWFVDTLSATGNWQAKPLLKDGHVSYFESNNVKDADMIVKA